MGAKATSVVTITDSDLEDNGGQYKLMGKYAVKVRGNDSLGAIGGVPVVVYPVSKAQIDSGEFELIQGPPDNVTQVSGRGRESGAWAIPVYHVGPGTWPGGGQGGCDLDPEYCAVEANYSTQPSGTWRNAASQLFVDVRAALGISTLGDAFDFMYLLAHEVEADALINIVTPGTYDASVVGGIAFEVSRGFTGNGTTGYLNTNAILDILTWYSRTNACFGVYSRTDINANVVDIGASSGSTSQRALHQIRSGGLFSQRVNNDSVSVVSVANPDSLGLYTGNRSAHTAEQAYKNGVGIGTTTGASVSVAGQELFIGARNTAGTPSLFSTRQYAFAFAGRSMNATEQGDFYNAVQTFMITIGADVSGALPAPPLVEPEPLTEANALSGILLAQQGINPTGNFGAYTGL